MMNSVFKNTVWLVLMLLFCLQPAFAEPSTPTYDFVDKGDGTVIHGKTGLMWMRCAIGQTWTGSTCSGEATEYKWNEAMTLKSDFAGYKDWRLPTIDELKSIIETEGNPHINTTIFPTNKIMFFWSSSPYANASDHQWFVNFSKGFDKYTNYGYDNHAVRLVRNGEWGVDSLALEIDKQKYKEFKQRAEAERQEAARQAKEERERQARYQKFRKHIKEGDDTTDGVVVQVKGNLVKIQTSESQCTQRDYQDNCKNYVNTSVEKWFKRSEIYPRD